MESFDDKIAVITGGGTGMGRELARQLAGRGCQVAMCDVSAENMEQTKALCEGKARPAFASRPMSPTFRSKRISCGFRDGVMREHETDYVNLVFNNAGIGGYRQHDRRPTATPGSGRSTCVGTACTTGREPFFPC